MARETCYECAVQVVKEASKKFGEAYVLDEIKAANLQKICELVEKMIPVFDCEYFDVEVDEVRMWITITLVSEDVIFDRGSTPDFLLLLSLIDFIRFSRPEPDTLRTELILNHMWERV